MIAFQDNYVNGTSLNLEREQREEQVQQSIGEKSNFTMFDHLNCKNAQKALPCNWTAITQMIVMMFEKNETVAM